MLVDVTHTTNIRPKRLVIMEMKNYQDISSTASICFIITIAIIIMCVKRNAVNKKQNMRSRSLYDGGNNRTRRKYTHTATLSAINIYTHSAYISIACFFYFPHQHFCTFMSNNNNNKWVNKRIEWRWMYFS